MELKNSEVQAAVPALKVLLKAKGITGRAAFRIARLVRAVEPISLDLAKARAEVYGRYVEKGKDGKPTPVVRDGKPVEGLVNITDPEGLRREMDELLAEAVEIAAEPLRLADLEEAQIEPVREEDGSTLDMGLAGVMAALGPLLADEDAPAEAA